MAYLQRGCCCTIRTCVLVLGWLSLVCGIIVLAGFAYWSSADCNVYDHAQLRDACTSAKNAQIVQVVFYAIWVLCAILLLIGVYKENRILLIPYLISHALMLIYSVINAIVQAVEIGFNTQIVMFLVFVILFLALSVYIFLCVVSHYQNLRDGIRQSGGGAPKV